MTVGMLGIFAIISVPGDKRFLAFGGVVKPEEAKQAQEDAITIRQGREKRYDIAIQIWLIGISCLIISILVYELLNALSISL
jgi:hypothetical protein